jgi:hypothetical protein
MRAVLALSLVALTGCRALFGFEDPARTPDAAIDAADLCGTHDEDGDGVPDLCDNCPHVFNPGQENTGEVMAGNSMDDLGDACDGTTTAECILLFDPFTTLPPFVVGSAGSWELGTDGDSILQTDSTHSSTFLPVTEAVFDAELAFTSFRIVDMDPTLQDFQVVGLVHAKAGIQSDGLPRGYFAQYFNTATLPPMDESILQVIDYDTGPTINQPLSPPVSMRKGTRAQLGLAVTGSRVIGSVIVETSNAFAELAVGGIPFGAIGLRTRFVAAQFDYLLVIQARGSCD